MSKLDKSIDKDRVKSLDKGLNILMLLSQAKEDLSLDQITKLSKYTKTSCFRLLKTMQELNFVDQNPQDSTYRLGARNISIGATALKNVKLRQLALPYMQRIQVKTKETSNLTILDQTEIIFVERLEAEHIVSTHHHIGDRLPVYCTSMGKAILAFMPQHQLEPLLKKLRLENKTKKTISSIDMLMKELENVRETGLAVNNEELEKGLCAVAAPIRNYLGESVAALNIAFPLIRYNFKDAVRDYGPLVKEAANEISERLGYTD